MTHEAQVLSHAHKDLAGLLAVGLVHRQVAHPLWTSRHSVVEGHLPSEGAVDELVGNDDVARLDVLLEGATGCGGYDMGAALCGQG